MDQQAELTLEEMRHLGSFSPTATVNIEWDKKSWDEFFAMTYALPGLTTGMMKGMALHLDRIKTLEANESDIHKTLESSKNSLSQVSEVMQRHNVVNKQLGDALVKISDSLARHISTN